MFANSKSLENVFSLNKEQNVMLCEIMQPPTEVGTSEVDGHECAFYFPGKGA